jgi:hypothetical protein
MSMSEKEEIQFPDAAKLFPPQRETVGGMMVYTAMVPKPNKGEDGGRVWLQTLLLDPNVKPVTPIMAVPHANVMAALNFHNGMLSVLKAAEAISKAPLLSEIEAVRYTMEQYKEEAERLEGVLEKEREKAKKAKEVTKKKST